MSQKKQQLFRMRDWFEENTEYYINIIPALSLFLFFLLLNETPTLVERAVANIEIQIG